MDSNVVTMRRKDLTKHIGKITVATHSGTFHCDDVLACAIFRYLYPSQFQLIRTRDQKCIDQCDIVIDVGSFYDPKALRFDHHQFESNSGPRFNYLKETSMSSVGMVFKEFGKRLIRKVCRNGPYINDSILTEVYNAVYNEFIEEIDAVDNGTKVSTKTGLSTLISWYNSDNVYDHKKQMRSFERAMDVGIDLLKRCIVGIVERKMHQKADFETVKRCFENRALFDPEKRILVLDANCPNWVYCLRKIEKGDKSTMFVLYEAENGEWIAKAVSDKKNEFRCKLEPESSYKFAGCKFVHRNGFIGGGYNLAATLGMVKFSLSKASP